MSDLNEKAEELLQEYQQLDTERLLSGKDSHPGYLYRNFNLGLQVHVVKISDQVLFPEQE